MIQSQQLTSSRVSLTTNSTSRNRIVRKPSNNQRQSRSKSKESRQNNNYPTQFIKSFSSQQNKAPLKQVQPILRRLRNDIAFEGSSRPIQKQNEKKRQPTPVKSRKELSKNDHSSENIIFEWQLKIAQLQNKTIEERKLREKFEKNYNKSSKELSLIRNKLQKAESENRVLKEERRDTNEKIEELEKGIMESENNLMTTKTNLQKLRQTIKQNRLLELQGDNRKIKKELEERIEENNDIRDQLQKLKAKLKSALEQNKQMMKRLDIEKIYKNQSMREQYMSKQIQRLKGLLKQNKEDKQLFLQLKIRQLEMKNRQKNEENHLLSIKLHMLEHKKQDEIMELKRKKEAQLKILRVKYSKLLNDMKTKNQQSCKTKKQTRRSQEINFQLSPQK